MDKSKELFLNIIRTAIKNDSAPALDIPKETAMQIITLADIHSLLPLVYNQLSKNPSLRHSPTAQRVRQLVMVQTVKTHEFTQVYQCLREAGCGPIVVKGFICRRLYPQPDLRLSTDEDLLVSEHQFEACCKVLESCSMATNVAAADFARHYEIPFRKTDGMLFIELHKTLFTTDSKIFSPWNRLFEDVFSRAVVHEGIVTMCPTDHLTYLLCHAFKHFIHSGFGIRQLCDIILFAESYGNDIDWQKVSESCQSINGRVFAATLFVIGEKHLGFDRNKACMPLNWTEAAEDEAPMLEDLLSAGVFGGATMGRRHSSNMTIDAVTADKEGKKTTKTLRGSLFPPAEKLYTRYPYLKEKPHLLPKAWAERGYRYIIETKNTKDNSAFLSLKTGSHRIELLKKYKVIK